MLFRKKIERACVYCAFSAKMDEEHMLCAKRGIVSGDSPCRKFRYDPTKRIPPRPKAPDFTQYREDDFSIEGVTP